MQEWWTPRVIEHAQEELKSYFSGFYNQESFQLCVSKEYTPILRVLLDDTPVSKLSNLERFEAVSEWIYQNLPEFFNEESTFYFKTYYAASNFYVRICDSPINLIKYFLSKGNFRFSIIIPDKMIVFTVFSVEYYHAIFIKYATDEKEIQLNCI